MCVLELPPNWVWACARPIETDVNKTPQNYFPTSQRTNEGVHSLIADEYFDEEHKKYPMSLQCGYFFKHRDKCVLSCETPPKTLGTQSGGCFSESQKHLLWSNMLLCVLHLFANAVIQAVQEAVLKQHIK